MSEKWHRRGYAGGGLVKKYPEMRETNYAGYSQRTMLNIWDADATLVYYPTDGKMSPGTELTIKEAKRLKKPCFVMRSDDDIEKFINFLHENFDEDIELNVAGPRESSMPGVHQKTKNMLQKVLTT